MRDKYGPTFLYLHEYREVIKSAAELRGLTVSAYVRLTCGEAARRDLAFGSAKNAAGVSRGSDR